MSVCVCGHPRHEHRTTCMSVPLSRHKPIYPIPNAFVSIANTHANATYYRDECVCGCNEYLEDAG